MLVQIIQATGASRYLDFMPVEGSFCVRNEKLYKVPATASEALKTNLVGMLQKRYMKNVLKFVVSCDDLESGPNANNDAKMLSTMTTKDFIMTKEWCSQNTVRCLFLHDFDSVSRVP